MITAICHLRLHWATVNNSHLCLSASELHTLPVGALALPGTLQAHGLWFVVSCLHYECQWSISLARKEKAADLKMATGSRLGWDATLDNNRMITVNSV